jgi:hypothetical protein
MPTIPNNTLDMLGAKNDDFGFEETLSTLKKIVIDSNMYGGFFVDQLLRIFFFPRIEN